MGDQLGYPNVFVERDDLGVSDAAEDVNLGDEAITELAAELLQGRRSMYFLTRRPPPLSSIATTPSSLSGFTAPSRFANTWSVVCRQGREILLMGEASTAATSGASGGGGGRRFPPPRH